MNILRKLIVSTILVGALSISSAVLAQDSAGMVVASRGEVIAMANGGSRELKQGDFVYEKDEILTSNRSFAVLQFVDGAKVTVRPDSTLIIEQYLYNGNGEDAATLGLVSGGLRVITGAMAKSNPENYKVRTPVALMGVRGTEFSVMLCGDEVCAEDEMVID
ncbi:MAG: FecR domain-containing protein [Xanthomonadales bacterium]|nr:FecR domain-containing protein [Xanthomonadales bacterium]